MHKLFVMLLIFFFFCPVVSAGEKNDITVGKYVKDLIKLKNLNGNELDLSLDNVLEKGENITPEQPLVFELSSGEEFIISVTRSSGKKQDRQDNRRCVCFKGYDKRV